MAWLAFGCLGLFLWSWFVFNMREEARSWEPLLPSKVNLTDWPRGQTPHVTPLLSWATRLHHTVWFVVSHLQTTHLSGQGRICSDPTFWTCETTDVWAWFGFDSNTTFLLCHILDMEGCHIHYTYYIYIIFIFILTLNKLSNQSVNPKWLTSWWVSERNRNGNKAKMTGNMM